MPDATPARTASPRALVVDDEPSLVRVVVGYLEADGFEVDSAGDGPTALDIARQNDPDVIVLDLGLPGMDGVEVCRTLRTFTDAYVVMLTARADEVDMLVGLAVGADDYITKPFSPRELMARIRTLMRRPRRSGAIEHEDATADRADEALRVFGALVIDVLAREVTLEGRPVELTRTEFDLLDTLSERPRVVFSRSLLLQRVWDGGEWAGDEHLVDVHIGRLRRKLADDAREARYVLTIRGVGYRMGQG
ncbi:MAG: response regulator transcription factor [Intrasporangium sp.]|uniref:response regulator transcription factor n=1 Tax=Intrasporangium sp. TaxID=1925024 RepID=UPI00264799EF|nr:response regulator transcription factor [Intrasporangium sp.]MDN5797488.1 response regulator transcription factor [Intrasporangium sp.]